MLQKEMMSLKISHGGSHGVASAGTCFKRLQRPFALLEELFLTAAKVGSKFRVESTS